MGCNQDRLNCTPEEIMAAASLPCGQFYEG